MLSPTMMDSLLCSYTKSYMGWRSLGVMKSRTSHRSVSRMCRHHKVLGILSSVASVMKHSQWRGV
jgi:hypothetical protein